jgi:hypothetical protein
MLDTGCWILDTGYWILDTGSENCKDFTALNIQYPVSGIQYPASLAVSDFLN